MFSPKFWFYWNTVFAIMNEIYAINQYNQQIYILSMVHGIIAIGCWYASYFYCCQLYFSPKKA
jgi:hypothetical protein